MSNSDRFFKSTLVVWLILTDIASVLMVHEQVKKPTIEFIGFIYGAIVFLSSTGIIYQLSKLFTSTKNEQ